MKIVTAFACICRHHCQSKLPLPHFPGLLDALTAVRPSCRAPGCWCEAWNGFHIDGVIIPHTKACITVRMAVAAYEARSKAEMKI